MTFMTFTKRDFSHLTRFPGTHGNDFDVLLQWADRLEKLPALLFALLLLLLAGLGALGDPTRTGALWLFLLGDWALLEALPRAGKSFGPAKPPALVLAVARLPFALLPQPLALLAQFLGTALVVYGFWLEPHRLTVTRQQLRSPKLNPNAPPLRLLHLGDLHIERVTQRERDLNRLIVELQPDVIVFSGDFLNLSNIHDPVAWEHCRTIIKEWHAPLGVYAVTGSPAVDQDEVVPRVLEGMPLRWLRDEKVTLNYNGQTIDLIGLACTHKPFVDRPALDRILSGRPRNFTVLLYHSPDLAPEAAEAGVDLQLSGHTHGGQVRLPFFGALYAGSLYGKQLECGRYEVNGLTLYVTRGIGMEGKGAPRVRFLCPPEIILWELSG
ncbi:MAG: metallophosphoesterase [Anaerolineales bacterium]|nr:metallophosphoesterase [Anaerolineales bacterium]